MNKTTSQPSVQAMVVFLTTYAYKPLFDVLISEEITCDR